MFDELIARAAQQFNVEPAALRGRSRALRVAHARQAVAWVLRERERWSLMDIGDALGRDHTTIMYGVKAAELRAGKDGDYGSKLAALI